MSQGSLAGTAFSSQAAHQRRSAANSSKYRQAARIVAEVKRGYCPFIVTGYHKTCRPIDPAVPNRTAAPDDPRAGRETPIVVPHDWGLSVLALPITVRLFLCPAS